MFVCECECVIDCVVVCLNGRVWGGGVWSWGCRYDLGMGFE